MQLYSYILRRVLLLIPNVWIVTVIVFMLCRFVPGSAIELLIAQLETMAESGTEEIDVEAVEHALGLDVPVYMQYARWIGVLPYPDGKGFDGLFQGSLGYSLQTGKPVFDEFMIRWPVTAELGLLSVIFGWAIGLPVGLGSAIRQDSLIDYGGRTFAILMLSLPGFWLATIIIIYGSIWYNWSPSLQYIPLFENPVENLKMFWLPAFLMGSGTSGAMCRMIRTMMLEVLRQDYIRTAWSKGLRERTVLWRHAIRNAVIPVVGMFVGVLGALIGGSVIMEQIFCLPGVGRMTLGALNNRDYPTIQAMNLVMTCFVMAMHVIVDVLYGVLDPRIRYY